MDGSEGIRVFHGIEWLLDDLLPVPTEAEMGYMYGEKGADRGAYLEIAEIMRNKTRKIVPDIFNNFDKDVTIETGNQFIAASPPRPYEEWVYDCAKSDIVVIGPKEMEVRVIQRLKHEESTALEEKRKIWEYLPQFEKELQELHDSGLIDGILGRGSYFAANGFPIKDDNIDFVLLREGNWSDEEKEGIINILKKLPAAWIYVIGAGKNGNKIDIGNGKEGVYFTLVDSRSIEFALGLRYERYILQNSIGIEIAGMGKDESESVAKRLCAMLPAHNRVSEFGLPRLQKPGRRSDAGPSPNEG